MTLIEIMIVVIIMAMIATGVAVAVMPQLKRAQEKAAESDIAAIRSAVQLYLATDPNSCPSIDDLIEAKVIDKGKRMLDPWDNEFVIKCVDDDPDVFSMGKDGQEGTEDDIHMGSRMGKKED